MTTGDRERTSTKPEARRVVINADDFGLSPGVTAGILEAHAVGTVTSTSMMVGCPGWDDAVAKGRAAASLGIGLHFNILVGRPLTAARTLTDRRTGEFLPLGALVRRALAGWLSGDEVEGECESQIAAIRKTGISVTHIDSHRHTHCLPGVRRAVANVAARERLPLRRPVESGRWITDHASSWMHRALVGWSWRATSAGMPSTRAPDNFMGISLQGGAHFLERFQTALDRLPDGSTEIMVHPGYVDGALRVIDGYTWPRERERWALTSATVRERLAKDDIALVSFASL